MSYRTVRLIPFIFSVDVAYVVEFGDYYARFFYDGEVLTNDADAEIWIETPYAEADLYAIHYQQRGDELWLVHPSYAPRILSRTAVTTFSLDRVLFRNGPFLTRNDLIDPDDPSTTTLACSVTALGANGILESTAELFLQGHVGSLFKLVHPRSTTQIEQNAAGTSAELPVKGTWTFYTHGTWTGTVLIERQENGGDWETFRTFNAKNDRNIGQAYVENYDNVLYRITVEAGLTGSIGSELSVAKTITEGVVRITSVINPFLAACEVTVALDSTDATRKWAEGAWNGQRGYPATIAFFEDRAVLGGASLPLEDTDYSTSEYPALRV